ncbi:MAG TPA: HPr family phosphocarrier protein [Ktedonobacteraceae bacterium]|jgi:phosphotransferase system HPr (HPr) family protein|nr:HPr family phosphocarrier protein [Ktedonobacteraceae bacterium]
MAVSQEVEVQHVLGLHARPAATFVKVASTFTSRITIENTDKNAKTFNAKSIMSVMLAGVRKNHHIMIVADGEDEQEALDALVALVNDNFGEAE